MKLATFITTTDENNAATVSVTAIDNETASIIITAGSLQEAATLLQEGEEKALEAMRIWKPTDAPVEEKTPASTFKKAPVSIETARQQMGDFEKTTAGKRFKAGLKRAKDFTEKHDKGGLNISRIQYLMLDSYAKGAFDAIINAYSYGYKRGHNAAKKEGGK